MIIYENKLKIANLSDKIIKTVTQKEMLKAWISPINRFKANLLYSYQIDYPEKMVSVGLFSKDNFTIMKDVKEFHEKCDNLYSILVLCKSKTQIFGGYIPLCFSSNKEYKYDNDSFSSL